jgi:hypothetical protein
MTEKILQSKLVAFLNHHKIYHFKLVACGSSGHPDYVLCIKGQFIGIECKSSDGIQSELQKYRMDQIRKAGGLYYLVTPENYCRLTELLKQE